MKKKRTSLLRYIKKMLRPAIALGLALFLFGGFFVVPTQTNAAPGDGSVDYWPTYDGELHSASAVVMELSSGTILYEHNMHDRHYPASITKMLTVLLALENCELSEIVTFSKDAVYKIEGTHIARDVGEEMTLEDTLYAVLLGSANECAYATAEHVTGGDYQAFVDMMNERAQAIGCLNTNFTNPHGLPDENHYTSAYDMALIAREAFQNETFRTISDTSKYVIPPTNKHEESTYIVNHHRLHNYYQTGEYVYEYCIGGKSGYTNAARNTLVTYAEKDGMQIVCVVMRAEYPYHLTDTTDLCNFYLDNFQVFNVAESETRFSEEGFGDISNFIETISYLKVDKDAGVVLPKAASLADAEVELQKSDGGEAYASLVYKYAGRTVGTANLISKGTLPEEFPFGGETTEEGTNQEAKPKFVVTISAKIVVFAALILVILTIIIVIIIYLKRNIYIIMHYVRQRRADRRRELHFAERDRRRRKREKNRRDY